MFCKNAYKHLGDGSKSITSTNLFKNKIDALKFCSAAYCYKTDYLNRLIPKKSLNWEICSVKWSLNFLTCKKSLHRGIQSTIKRLMISVLARIIVVIHYDRLIPYLINTSSKIRKSKLSLITARKKGLLNTPIFLSSLKLVQIIHGVVQRHQSY